MSGPLRTDEGSLANLRSCVSLSRRSSPTSGVSTGSNRAAGGASRLRNSKIAYEQKPFDSESELEEAVKRVAPALFGTNRIYLDIKKKIAAKGKINNIPDGYLLDLSSKREPRFYVVENELSRHTLRHIAVQVLEFSLSFECQPQAVKDIIKDALAGMAKETPYAGGRSLS